MYTFRALTRSDLPALHALLSEAARADGEDHVEDPDDLALQFDDPWSEPARDSLLAVDADGRLCGYGRLFVNPDPNPERTSFLQTTVAPAHRGRGLEDEILEWLEARARMHPPPAHDASPLSWRLRTALRDTRTGDIDRLMRRGYRPARDYHHMRRDLEAQLPPAAWPPGVTLRAYMPGDETALWSAHVAAFADHWGYQLETPADFRQLVIDSATFRPDLTLLAWADDEVVAYAINRVADADNARTGLAEGKISLLGTRRAWRGRGLGHALLSETLRRFKAAGLTHAALTVDAENITGALRLYTGLGFVVVRTTRAFDLVFD